MRKSIVLGSCLAWLLFLALALISFVYPSMIAYGHVSKPTEGRCNWFAGYIHVGDGESEWHFEGASNFDADVSGGGFHWERTSMFPPLFAAQGSIWNPSGATQVRLALAFPLCIPLAIFALPPAIWAYRRRRSRKQTAGFPVIPA